MERIAACTSSMEASKLSGDVTVVYILSDSVAPRCSQKLPMHPPATSDLTMVMTIFMTIIMMIGLVMIMMVIMMMRVMVLIMQIIMIAVCE